MKPAARSAWFLWPLIALPLGGAAVLFLYPKLLTGDFAEITIESITSPAPGEAEIRYRGRISHGTGLTGSLCTELPGIARRPRRLEGASLTIYTLRNERGDLGTPAEVLGRLSVQPGKSYRIRPDRPLALFRYVAFDGAQAEMTLSVWPE